MLQSSERDKSSMRIVRESPESRQKVIKESGRNQIEIKWGRLLRVSVRCFIYCALVSDRVIVL